MTPSSHVLVLDTASPVVSVALGGGDGPVRERTLELRQTSERLLAEISALLADAGVALRDLAGVAALQGPGSFTGLRIGLATVLGLHQAIGLRATALPTLPLLADAGGRPGEEVAAAVDAMRGDWYVQRFRLDPAPVALTEPELAAADTLRRLPVRRLVAFGVSRLATEAGWNDAAPELIEPPPLAAIGVRHAAGDATLWDPARLTAPIYFRPPAVTLPRRP